MQKPGYQKTSLICLYSATLLLCDKAVSAGGIVTDGTVGPAKVISAPNSTANVEINQVDGTTAGRNLFHSFSKFNINTGQTVTFSENTVNSIDNVISRVTGGTSSNIDGTLRSTPGGHADYYLINPSGVVFNKNAQLDVPAAFHASTADEIKFRDGGKFSARQTAASKLSTASPSAFGFLGTSHSNNGFIKVIGSKLNVNERQIFDFTAGEIDISNNAKIVAPAGYIRLSALRGKHIAENNAKLAMPNQIPNLSNSGDINISQNSLIDGSGNGGARIDLWGKDILVKDSAIFADNVGFKHARIDKGIAILSNYFKVDKSFITFDILGDGNGEDIEVNSNQAIDIVNGGSLTTSVFSSGNAGNIKVKTKNLSIIDDENQNLISALASDSGIFGNPEINSRNLGKGGNIIVSADTISVLDGAEIRAGTFGFIKNGNGGSIRLNANNMNINGTESGILAVTTGPNQGGNVKLVVAGQVSMQNGGSILAITQGSGNAGNVYLKAKNLIIDGKGKDLLTGITSGTLGAGNAGNVVINLDGNLNIKNTGQITAFTRDFFNIGEAGNGGTVHILANNVNIDGEGNNKLFTGITSATDGVGNAGRVIIISKNDISLKNNGQITATTFGLGSGKGGNIEVSAANISIDGVSSIGTTGISASAIKEPENKKSVINAGNAGNVTIKVGDTLQIINGGEISSISKLSSNAGNIDIRAKTIKLSNKGIISTSTESKGKAGSISINNGNLFIGKNSEISSASKGIKSSGRTGNINISASNSIRLWSGAISITNESKGLDAKIAASITPGNISIRSRDLTLVDSSISSASLGNVSAGGINIQFKNTLFMDPSFITTNASQGNGGAIDIRGGELIRLQNSGITTNVGGLFGNGGDINIDTNALVMETGLIQANTVAKNGFGGDINLNLNALIPSGNMLILGGSQPADWQLGTFGSNIIQAAAPNGLSGQIQSSAPQLNLSGELSNLGAPQFDSGFLSPEYCSLGTGSGLQHSGKRGFTPIIGDTGVY